MNDTTVDAAAAMSEARRIIIEGINAGLSIQAAVRRAIDAGVDEILAHQVGRTLRDDLIKARKRQALGRALTGCLIAVAGFAAFSATVFYPPAQALLARVPFSFTIEVIAFIGGLLHAIFSLFSYFTASDKVR